MTDNEQTAFYVGAALYRDLDSFEVDQILAAAGLDIDAASIADCCAAVDRSLIAKLDDYLANFEVSPGLRHFLTGDSE